MGADLCATMEQEAGDRCEQGADCFTVGCYESLPFTGSCEPDGLALVDVRAIRRAGRRCEAAGWVMATQEPLLFCEGPEAPPPAVELKVSCAPDYML